MCPCVSMPRVDRCPWRSEEGVESPQTVAYGPFQEHCVPLTSEPLVWPLEKRPTPPRSKFSRTTMMFGKRRLNWRAVESSESSKEMRAIVFSKGIPSGHVSQHSISFSNHVYDFQHDHAQRINKTKQTKNTWHCGTCLYCQQIGGRVKQSTS